MRLWSIHPKYLDSKGLVALWREALLAQNVLLGRTKGYRHHPQLMRFRNSADPEAAIACYLHAVADEAERRGYSFDRKKIVSFGECSSIPVSEGQLAYERNHLLNKLKIRDPGRYEVIKSLEEIEAHPLFKKVGGGVEEWEVVQ